MAESTTLEHMRYRIRRDTHGVAQWFRGNWRETRWFRWLSSLVGAGLVLMLIGWAVLAKDLPDAETLIDYQPPLPTIVPTEARLEASMTTSSILISLSTSFPPASLPLIL